MRREAKFYIKTNSTTTITNSIKSVMEYFSIIGGTPRNSKHHSSIISKARPSTLAAIVLAGIPMEVVNMIHIRLFVQFRMLMQVVVCFRLPSLPWAIPMKWEVQAPIASYGNKMRKQCIEGWAPIHSACRQKIGHTWIRKCQGALGHLRANGQLHLSTLAIEHLKSLLVLW